MGSDLNVRSIASMQQRRTPPASHRALYRLWFPAERWVLLILLPLGFSFLHWLVLEYITSAWRGLFSACFEWLGWEASVVIERVLINTWLTLDLPRVMLEVRVIDGSIWLGVASATVLALVVSFFLPERLLPLRYLLRFAVLIEASALAMFALWPGSFPHTATSHVRDGMLMTLVFSALIPWMHALTYYIFDFSVPKKLGLTLLTLGYLLLFAPFQYLAHLWLLKQLSLLVLPVLYLLFGVPLQILIFVAFFGWGMSWERLPARRTGEYSRLADALREVRERVPPRNGQPQVGFFSDRRDGTT
jgi:hypothetical protein